MPIEKLDLGQTPRLEITCYANLDIRGYQTAETRLESDSSSFQVTPTESGVQVESYSNCAVRMPEQGSLHIFEASGGLRVKDLLGSVDLESVKGSCYLRRTGPIRLTESYGELRIRETAGDVAIGTVHGSFTMREVRGSVEIENVSGDLILRDIAGAIRVEEVSGDMAIRSQFPAESVSHFGSINGDAVFRVEGTDGARFVLGSQVVDLKIPSNSNVIEEGEAQIVVVGNGLATIQVDAASSLNIKYGGEVDAEASFAYSFAIGSEISDHLSDITAEIEAQSEKLEANLAATSDRVRRQVERSLSIARRQVEAAQRRVEREAGQGAPHIDLSFSVGRKPESSPAEPVSETERLTVLRMLEEGQIDVKQAEELLAALEGKH
jgi:hypothetical protein